jgi:hypothetical protein
MLNQNHADTRGLLTPGLLTPGALLVPEECQHQRLAGTRTLLTPGLCWHQDFAGTRTWLIPGLGWHQKLRTATTQLSPLTSSCRVAIFLLQALLLYHHFTHMYSFPADLQKGINIWLRVTCDLNF